MDASHMVEPIYEGGFQSKPRPEHIVCVTTSEHPLFCAGIKTITHDRSGREIIPHKVVVIEMTGCTSFDFSPTGARQLAHRLIEFAQSIEEEPRKL